MAKISTWTDVDVFMESVLGPEVAVSAISKASEGIVTTSASHSITTGDYVLVKAQGMAEVQGRIFRAKAASGSVLTLEGENTTDYGAFSSGTVQKVTYGTTISTLTSVSSSGGEFDEIDTTTIHDKARSSIPGLAAASNFNFDSIWDVSDAGLIAAKQASSNKAQRGFMFVFANGQRVVFYGYIGAKLSPGGSTGGMVTTSVTIRAQGELTTYAT